MSILLYSELMIHAPERYAAYMEKVGPLFLEHGVTLHANDTAPVPISGQAKPDKVVVIEFRDEAHMQSFLALPAYQAAAADRDAGITERTMIFKRYAPA